LPNKILEFSPKCHARKFLYFRNFCQLCSLYSRFSQYAPVISDSSLMWYFTLYSCIRFCKAVSIQYQFSISINSNQLNRDSRQGQLSLSHLGLTLLDTEFATPLRSVLSKTCRS